MSLLYVRERKEAPQQLPQDLLEEVMQSLHDMPPRKINTYSNRTLDELAAEISENRLNRDKIRDNLMEKLVAFTCIHSPPPKCREEVSKLGMELKIADEEYMEMLKEYEERKQSTGGAP